MARKFFYVCAGLFLLAGAFALGASGVWAQSAQEIAGFTGQNGGFYVITPAGDVYGNPSLGITHGGPAVFIGNFWSGTTPVTPATLGQVKARYR